MTESAKNLLTMLICILALFLMVFVFPQCASTPAAEPPAKIEPARVCPIPVPAGCLSPADLLGPAWTVVNAQRDVVHGLFWFFLECSKVTDGRTHALVVVPAGQDWPILYNYLENGALVFLRLTESGYVVEKVEVDVYNTVAKYYEMYLGVKIQKRSEI